MSAPSTVVDNLDGSHTEYFDVDATEATLLALARELFEDHWEHVRASRAPPSRSRC